MLVGAGQAQRKKSREGSFFCAKNAPKGGAQRPGGKGWSVAEGKAAWKGWVPLGQTTGRAAKAGAGKGVLAGGMQGE